MLFSTSSFDLWHFQFGHPPEMLLIIYVQILSFLAIKVLVLLIYFFIHVKFQNINVYHFMFQILVLYYPLITFTTIFGALQYQAKWGINTTWFFLMHRSFFPFVLIFFMSLPTFMTSHPPKSFTIKLLLPLSSTKPIIHASLCVWVCMLSKCFCHPQPQT